MHNFVHFAHPKHLGIMTKKIILAALMAFILSDGWSKDKPQKAKIPDPKPYYEIRINETITFKMLEHIGGGYVWRWMNRSQTTVVDSLKATRWIPKAEKRKYGGPSYIIWTFKAVRPGVDTLRFEELRVFQRNSTITIIEIAVRVR